MTDAATDTTALAEALAAEPGIVVAYLFGSRARGDNRSRSDTDVAVLFADNVDGDRRRLDLRARLGDDVDLVVLNDAPVALAYRVLRDGVLLVCNDDAARIEHWVRTVDRYIDMAPMRRMLDEGLRHRLAEGRFGRS